MEEKNIMYGSRLVGKNIQKAYQLVDWMAKNKGCKNYAILTLDELSELQLKDKMIEKVKEALGKANKDFLYITELDNVDADAQLIASIASNEIIQALEDMEGQSV